MKVTVSWDGPGGRKGSAEARTDYRGIYRVCSVPAGAALALEAEAPGTSGSVTGLVAQVGRPLQQDLEIPRPSAALAAAASPRPEPAGPGARPGSTVYGRVVAADGSGPLAGAVVRLRDGVERRTDREGRFTLENVAAGAYDVAVSHPERGESSVRVNVSGRQDVDLTLRMRGARQETVALAPLVATARPTTGAEAVRRAAGTRHNIITREDIERVGTGARNIQNVLRACIPAIHVRGRATAVTCALCVPARDLSFQRLGRAMGDAI